MPVFVACGRRFAGGGCLPRRLLSLLLYAESNDLPVPTRVIESLFDTVHGTNRPGGTDGAAGP